MVIQTQSMKVKFYGTSSAIPSPKRAFACIGVHLDSRSGLVLDCGDGSIRELIRSQSDVNWITSILVTHHHSDHLTGLTSIIETMAIQKRTNNLSVYGPTGLRDYFAGVQKATNVAHNKKFEISVREILPGERLRVNEFNVSTFEMDHTLPCLGYRIESGHSVMAYTGDTQPTPETLELAREVDLLIHEATYLKKDIEKARTTKHSTSLEAAQAALESNSKKLVMTHVNDSAESPEEMLEEARPIFKEVSVAYDGLEMAL